MSERRMRAYYYSFTPTGVEAVDLILHAIACAGKAYHHTDQWTEECPGYGECVGNSPVEWIQNAADQAAKQWPVPQQAVELSSRLADAICLLIIHGIISDAERDRAYKRLDVWAQKSGLKRKGQP